MIVPQLAARFQEGSLDVPILGYIAFWNVHDVKIGLSELASQLQAVGISSSYVREHNYRSSFIRALRNLEEQRIIRRVEEDKRRIVYQFTTEKKGSANDDVCLDYERETVVVIDKDVYRETGNFETALIKGSKEVRARIVELFNEEKTTFKSSDLSRTLQSIFRREGDLVPLRQQGAIYFIPASFRPLVDSVSRLAGLIAGLSFQYVPILDVTASRTMVATAASSEFEELLKRLDEEVDKASQEGGASERWLDYRHKQIASLKQRLERYVSVLEQGTTKKIKTSLEKLEERLTQTRALEL